MNSKLLGGIVIVNFLFVGAATAMPKQATAGPDPQASSMVEDVEPLTKAERRGQKKAERKAARQAKREARRAQRDQLAQEGRLRPRYRSLSRLDRFDPYYPYGLGFRSGFRRSQFGGFSRFGFRTSRFSRFGYYGGFRRGFGW
ncbi:MAG: hypothetical protein AAF438_16605 [Pseudomonadota bacterium]